MITIEWNPTHRFLRQFSALFVVFFAAIGAFRYFQKDDLDTAKVLWMITPLGLVGLAFPAFMRYVYVTWMALFFPLGWTVSMVILTSIYYLVVSPIGLMMRLLGHDPCGRRPDPEANSYWKPRKTVTDAGRYFRQF
tara:strand:- start:5337 stop:5744 length:408 start_codon:yes stop_codon:yes gene_type:complete